MVIKPQVNSRFITKINNINYNNNNNNNNNINDFNFTLCKTKSNQVPYTPSGRDGLASLSRPADSPSVPQVVSHLVWEGMPAEFLPSNWRGLKIDIFNNGDRLRNTQSIKVKLSIIKQDSSTQSLIALMNSPSSYVWRQVNSDDRNQPHWLTVSNIQDYMAENNISYRVSKCSLPRKGGSTDVILFLLEDDQYWYVKIIKEAQELNYHLDKSSKVTPAQRAGNIVASKFIGQSMRPLITAKELGI